MEVHSSQGKHQQKSARIKMVITNMKQSDILQMDFKEDEIK